MRFQCRKCKFPVRPPDGVSLVDAICPKCQHALDLDSEDRKFQQFEILEFLGAGGFGTVCKVRDCDCNELFTLKLIRREKVSKAEQVHLLRQIHSSREIKHSNIVAAHDFGQSDEYWYLVSDYVAGEPLNRWAKQTSPDWREVLSLVGRIAEVLQYVHNQGFVHRDLKPGNIIIGDDDEPHIIDFGLCVCLHDSELMAIERYRAARQAIKSKSSTKKQLLLGTPGYAAPEQLQGDPLSATPSSDLYSLGVILFELLTSQKPEEGILRFLNRSKVKTALTKQGASNLVAKEIAKYFSDCLNPKKEIRPLSAAEIAAACRRFAA